MEIQTTSQEENHTLESIETQSDESLQLAENSSIEQNQKERIENEFEEKRRLLDKTKIVRQTWSISEIYQKIKDGRLILDPDYQRRAIWNNDKKTAFIESLYMEIMIPPIYVVEVPSADPLEETKYEVVDGKQRLTAITEFIREQLKLTERILEYYGDIFGGKKFGEIYKIAPELTSKMLSSILDIYVITANSPQFTKYDIFARLNRGAEKLKVNEIRRAIYKSQITDQITEFVDRSRSERKVEYETIFSANDIKRFDDYGRFYRSIAFYIRSNIEDGAVVGYNSRPREMINNVLQELQSNSVELEEQTLRLLLERTLEFKRNFLSYANADYIIDAIVPFVSADLNADLELSQAVFSDARIQATLEKSPATTSNVNARLELVKRIAQGK